MADDSTKKRKRLDEAIYDGSLPSTSPKSRESGSSKLTRHDATSKVTSAPSYVTVHRVTCSNSVGRYHFQHKPSADYLDVPCLRAGANWTSGLEGLQPVAHVGNYLEDYPEFSFAVCMVYDCNRYHQDIKNSFQRRPLSSTVASIAPQMRPLSFILERDAIPAVAGLESIFPSQGLNEALGALRKVYPEFPDYHATHNLTYPYLELYHCKGLLADTSLNKLHARHKIHLSILVRYLEQRLASECADAEALFAQGLVTKKHWARLFRRNEVVVTTLDGSPRAYISPSCPILDEHLSLKKCRSWGFDGKFFTREQHFDITWPSQRDIIPITDLQPYPLRFNQTGLRDALLHRGLDFWRCRWRRFVNYVGPLQAGEEATSRYMIDVATYKLLHKMEQPDVRHALDDEAMYGEDPPADTFTLLLPATIEGFDFQKKKWSTLLVEHVRDIVWDRGAFSRRLVLPESKKELIKAVITAHTHKEEYIRSDLIGGEGGGLNILLHGAPGTGKTLTAESVAEFTERPLYRITSGDIGTNPEDIDKYLEAVFFISARWESIVLLDDADMYLEARTKADIQRTALVSVFIRAIKAYKGILILTTNRVDTFDEEFRSHVQLALHYPPLNRETRYEVWNNFIRSLAIIDEDVNVARLRQKLDNLARLPLNGRQIKNAINTARQIAWYKTQELEYTHFETALQVVDDVGKYTRGRDIIVLEGDEATDAD